MALTGLGTGVILKSQTNTAGIYWISGLVAGPYRIDISKEGFASVTEPEIEMHVGETAVRDYQLSVGSVRDTVTVEASAILLDSATTLWVKLSRTSRFRDTPVRSLSEREALDNCVHRLLENIVRVEMP